MGSTKKPNQRHSGVRPPHLARGAREPQGGRGARRARASAEGTVYNKARAAGNGKHLRRSPQLHLQCTHLIHSDLKLLSPCRTLPSQVSIGISEGFYGLPRPESHRRRGFGRSLRRRSAPSSHELDVVVAGNGLKGCGGVGSRPSLRRRRRFLAELDLEGGEAPVEVFHQVDLLLVVRAPEIASRCGFKGMVALDALGANVVFP